MTLPDSRVALVLLTVVALLAGIDNMERPLANPDEGRYSEISREMALSGDWVTPRLNGIKYFEKPPLQYWATALSFKAFGVNEYSARLYTFLMGMGTILAAAYTASRLRGIEAAVVTALVLVSSPYFLALGGIVTLDMGLTCWTTVTFCALILAEQSRGRALEHRRWMVVAWAAMALAVLSKGLVGIVFPAAAFFLHAVLRRDFSILKRLEWSWGLPVFLVIVLPWFVAVSNANPEFARFFFIHEHFERFATQEHRRVEPWWYFLPIVIFGTLPWMFSLPAAIGAAWRSESGAQFQPLRLALLWSVFILVFFSASGSKLPAYVLPIFPPLALVLATHLVEAPVRKLALRAIFIVPVGLVLAVAAWRYPLGARDEWTRAQYLAAQPWALGGAVVLIIGTAICARLFAKGQRWSAIIVMALASIVMLDCIEDGYENLTPRQSALEVAERAKPRIGPDTRVYSVGHYEQTLPFYLERTVTLVEYVDEFEMGLKAEPGHDIPRLEQFPAEWLRPGDALAIMNPGVFEKLKAQGLPMRVLQSDPRRVLVRKP